jgi:hypothetical protein
VFNFLQADICLLPNDERTERVRVLARDFCAKRDGQKEPIFLTHPMLPGLLQVCASLHISSWCASKANLNFSISDSHFYQASASVFSQKVEV